MAKAGKSGHGGKREGAGRPSKADEKKRIAQRKALAKRLGKMGTTERTVLAYQEKLNSAFLDGDLSPRDYELMAKTVAQRLRAMLSRAGRTDMDDLRRIVEEGRKLQQKANASAAAQRQHLGEERTSAPHGGSSPAVDAGGPVRADVGAVPGLAPPVARS